MVQLKTRSVSDLGTALREAESGPIWDDPGRIRRILAYAIAYIGLLGLVLDMAASINSPFGGVWYSFFNRLGFIALAIGPVLGMRAIYGLFRNEE